jgi:hypothetical protein
VPAAAAPTAPGYPDALGAAPVAPAAPTPTGPVPAAPPSTGPAPIQYATMAAPGYPGYARPGFPMPGHPMPGYPMPATTGRVPRQGARIAAACVLFLMGLMQFYPQDYTYSPAQYVTVVGLATVGYLALGIFVLVDRPGAQLFAAIMAALGVLRMQVAPLLSDSVGYPTLQARAVLWIMLIFTIAVVVLLAIGATAGGRADPGGIRRRPPLVVAGGLLMLVIALFEFYAYFKGSGVDEWLFVPLAVGVLLLRGSQFGRIVAWATVGFQVLLDVKFLVKVADQHEFSYIPGWVFGFLAVEMLMLIAVAVLVSLPPAHPYFRREAPVAGPPGY